MDASGLMGVRVTVLARLRRDQVRIEPGITTLALAEHELLVPPRLARLLSDLATRNVAAVSRTAAIAAPESRWLFPGLRPGAPVTPEHLAQRLRTHGVGIRAGRNTPLAALAADLPPPVLADLVGIGISTAVRWARHARRDWAPYLAARANSVHN
jgi:hypothetical protein